MKSLLKAGLCAAVVLTLGYAAPTTAKAQSPVGKVYTVVEQEPEYPGGKAALSRYLAATIKFPNSLARQNVDTGPVAAKFIVDAEGFIHDVRVTTKPLTKMTRKGMQEFMVNIIAAIEKMPRWNPGEVNGQPVAVFYTLPIEVTVQ